MNLALCGDEKLYEEKTRMLRGDDWFKDELCIASNK